MIAFFLKAGGALAAAGAIGIAGWSFATSWHPAASQYPLQGLDLHYPKITGEALDELRKVDAELRGAETEAFGPGRKRCFTPLEMSVVVATVFACPDTGCFPRPPKRR